MSNKTFFRLSNTTVTNKQELYLAYYCKLEGGGSKLLIDWRIVKKQDSSNPHFGWSIMRKLKSRQTFKERASFDADYKN